MWLRSVAECGLASMTSTSYSTVVEVATKLRGIKTFIHGNLNTVREPISEDLCRQLSNFRWTYYVLKCIFNISILVCFQQREFCENYREVAATSCRLLSK